MKVTMRPNSQLFLEEVPSTAGSGILEAAIMDG